LATPYHLLNFTQLIINLLQNTATGESAKKGGQGGVKKTFLAFQKMNFNNSAICGIIKTKFLRTKKEQFLSTLSTPSKCYYIDNKRIIISCNLFKGETNDLIGRLIIGLGTVVVNWKLFNTAPGKY